MEKEIKEMEKAKHFLEEKVEKLKEEEEKAEKKIVKIEEKEMKIHEKESGFPFLNSYSPLRTVVLFALSYIITWVAVTVLGNPWDSPAYFLMPIPAFIFMYYSIDWIESFFELDEFFETLFIFVFIVLAFLAFIIAVSVYQFNIYTLTLDGNPQLKELKIGFIEFMLGGKLSNGQVFEGRNLDFLGEFIKSSYFVFVVSATLAWFSRKLAVNVFEGKK